MKTSINNEQTALLIAPQAHEATATDNSKERLQIEERCQQWALYLVERLSLTDFAVGSSPSAYHNVHVQNPWCSPARVHFGFAFVAAGAECEEQLPAKTQSLKGRRVMLPDGYTAVIKKAEVLFKDVFSKQHQGNCNLHRTTLVGVTELILTCEIHPPPADDSKRLSLNSAFQLQIDMIPYDPKLLPPRIRNRVGLSDAREKLQQFIDHPSAVSFGNIPGLDIKNEPIFIKDGEATLSMLLIDRLLAGVNYLSEEARLGLELCLSYGPMGSGQRPIANWMRLLDWSWEKSRRVLQELQRAGHAFEVRMLGGIIHTTPIKFWKFSARSCGLSSSELRGAVFKTNKPQFAVDGIKALPSSCHVHDPGDFYLGCEVALFNGVITPTANR